VKVLQGIDLVKTARIEGMIARRGKRFLDQVFSPAEQAYCGSKRMKCEHYAARLAAKEAFMKALKIRSIGGLPFAEIEVKHEPTGKPYLSLSERMRKAAALGTRDQIELSLAHEREYAMATVVVVKT